VVGEGILGAVLGTATGLASPPPAASRARRILRIAQLIPPIGLSRLPACRQPLSTGAATNGLGVHGVVGP